jgi:hypothetical protein
MIDSLWLPVRMAKAHSILDNPTHIITQLESHFSTAFHTNPSQYLNLLLGRVNTRVVWYHIYPDPETRILLSELTLRFNQLQQE